MHCPSFKFSIPYSSSLGHLTNHNGLSSVYYPFSKRDSLICTFSLCSKSSEQATKEPAKAEETNPIWIALKAFVTAFVKFWVE